MSIAGGKRLRKPIKKQQNLQEFRLHTQTATALPSLEVIAL